MLCGLVPGLPPLLGQLPGRGLQDPRVPDFLTSVLNLEPGA